MRIVCISSSTVPSDTANSIQVMKVCQSFVQLDHDVTLLVPGPQPPGTSDEYLRQHYGLVNSINVEWLVSCSRRWFPWKAVGRGMQFNPDLFYSWPLQSGVLGLLLGIPSLVELHDLPTGSFGSSWLKLFLAVPGKKRLLPITEALRGILHLPKKDSMVAPDGVDIDRYQDLPDAESARKTLNLPNIRTVLCTGHLYTGRGANLFINLARRFPSVSFVWVGGREEDVNHWRYQSIILDLPNVTFTGFVLNRLIPLYQASADVLLMPYESIVTTSSGGNTARVCSPMKLFEYMAAGRAILASDLPVLREVLDESMAVFCKPTDMEEWESALQQLLDDETKRANIGECAKQAAVHYSWVERGKKVLKGFV